MSLTVIQVLGLQNGSGLGFLQISLKLFRLIFLMGNNLQLSSALPQKKFPALSHFYYTKI